MKGFIVTKKNSLMVLFSLFLVFMHGQAHGAVPRLVQSEIVQRRKECSLSNVRIVLVGPLPSVREFIGGVGIGVVTGLVIAGRIWGTSQSFELTEMTRSSAQQNPPP